MAFLNINPRYQALVEQLGLTAPEHFLEMPSVIIGGHSDRNVARVTLGTRTRRDPWVSQARASGSLERATAQRPGALRVCLQVPPRGNDAARFAAVRNPLPRLDCGR